MHSLRDKDLTGGVSWRELSGLLVQAPSLSEIWGQAGAGLSLRSM